MAAGPPTPRALHPLAWWGWAVGVAVAAGMTLNPVLLAIQVAVVAVVVSARRSDSPWARAFKLYVALGVVIIVVRGVLHILVGFKWGTIAVLPLPSVALPDWAAGINLFGTVYLEGWLDALLRGAQLAVLVIAIGAANALANPKRLLRSLPNALHEVGTAVVVSVSVAPQLAESVQRVMRARLLRGDAERGLRAVPRVALPVLQDTLDRSLLLASAMESRGYGRPGAAGSGRRLESRAAVGSMTLLGLVGIAFGMYAILDPRSGAGGLGVAALIAGVALTIAGLALGGRRVRVTRYRPDPWRAAETITVLAGVAAAVGAILSRSWEASALLPTLQPLAPPELPIAAVAGALIALLPAFATPPPPSAPRRRS